MTRFISIDYWRWVARGDLGRIPRVFGPTERFKRSFNPAYRNLAVNRATDIVVEGYPRSGNTFAAQALQLLSPEAKIAHRCHSFTQVSLAAKNNIPCVVLIRSPTDAIVSAWIHADGKLSFPFLAQHYASFYRSCWSLRDHFLVSDFDTTTRNFTKVVQGLNDRWQTEVPSPSRQHYPNGFRNEVFMAIDRFYKSSQNTDQVIEAHVSRPSEDRERQKTIRRIQADEEIPMRLQARCEAWYQTYRTHSL